MRATPQLPGSTLITNRAPVLAALGDFPGFTALREGLVRGDDS